MFIFDVIFWIFCVFIGKVIVCFFGRGIILVWVFVVWLFVFGIFVWFVCLFGESGVVIGVIGFGDSGSCFGNVWVGFGEGFWSGLEGFCRSEDILFWFVFNVVGFVLKYFCLYIILERGIGFFVKSNFLLLFILFGEVILRGGDNRGVIGFRGIFLVFFVERIDLFFNGWWNGGVVCVVIEIVNGVKEVVMDVVVMVVRLVFGVVCMFDVMVLFVDCLFVWFFRFDWVVLFWCWNDIFEVELFFVSLVWFGDFFWMVEFGLFFELFVFILDKNLVMWFGNIVGCDSNEFNELVEVFLEDNGGVFEDVL